MRSERIKAWVLLAALFALLCAFASGCGLGTLTETRADGSSTSVFGAHLLSDPVIGKFRMSSSTTRSAASLDSFSSKSDLTGEQLMALMNLILAARAVPLLPAQPAAPPAPAAVTQPAGTP